MKNDDVLSNLINEFLPKKPLVSLSAILPGIPPVQLLEFVLRKQGGRKQTPGAWILLQTGEKDPTEVEYLGVFTTSANYNTLGQLGLQGRLFEITAVLLHGGPVTVINPNKNEKDPKKRGQLTWENGEIVTFPAFGSDKPWNWSFGSPYLVISANLSGRVNTLTDASKAKVDPQSCPVAGHPGGFQDLSASASKSDA